MRSTTTSSATLTTRFFVVQGAADPNEVFDLRRACVPAIVRVIHAPASSKLLNR